MLPRPAVRGTPAEWHTTMLLAAMRAMGTTVQNDILYLFEMVAGSAHAAARVVGARGRLHSDVRRCWHHLRGKATICRRATWLTVSSCERTTS